MRIASSGRVISAGGVWFIEDVDECERTMETTADNSRTANRMHPTTDTAVVHGLTEKPILAAVIDESFGGIGIAVPLKLEPDQGIDIELTVEYGGVSCVALVRHVAALPSGCRLGLEWKAQALSRCLRDLLKIQPEENVDLLRVLPGGLSMMWKIYESGRWCVLIDCAGRLRRQVGATDAIDLDIGKPIDQFCERVQEVADSDHDDVIAKQMVCAALNDLIKRCINAISDS